MDEFNTQTQMLLLDAASATANFATNWLIQSTLLIVAGLIVARLLQSRGSAVQSVVYRTTLVAALVCPLATFALASAGFSGWSVSLSSPWIASEPTQLSGNEVIAPSNIDLTKELTSQQQNVQPQRELPGFGNESWRAGDAMENNNESDLSFSVPEKSPDAVPAEIEPAVPVLAPRSAMAEAISVQPVGVFATAATACWIIIALSLLARLNSAWRKLGKLKRNAILAELELASICERLAGQMSVPAPNVLRSPFLPSPCLAGLRSPSILLPEHDCGLALNDVLIHELAHLRRHDCHWNLLRRIATSILFFQPLLWILSSRIEASAEEVCDDFVVQLGGDRVQYATRLVDIAELSTAPIAAAGVGVVSLRSMLSHRVTRIMDTSRTLSTRTSNLILVCVLSCGLVGTGASGLLGLNSAPPQDALKMDPATTETEANEEDESVVANRFAGKVVTPDGNPAPGAAIYFVTNFTNPELLRPTCKELAITDAYGAFEFSLDDHKEYRDSKYGSLVAVKAGFGFAHANSILFESSGEKLAALRKRINSASATEKQYIRGQLDRVGEPMRLTPDDQSISGQIIDIDGQPVVGATLTLLEISGTENNDLTEWREAATDPEADFYSARTKTINWLNGPQVRSLLKPAVTDRAGKFSIHGIGNGRIAQLLIEGSNIASAKIYVRTEPGKKIELLKQRGSPDLGSFTYYSNRFSYLASPTAIITGTVRDASSKEPLAGVTIKSQLRHGEPIRGIGEDFVRAVTDSEGKYRLVGMPIGKDNRIAAMAPEGTVAYFSTSKRAETNSPDDTVEVNFELSKGIWLEGQFTDKQTGKGLPGTLDYHILPSNPQYELAGEMNVDERDRLRADKNGNYRIAVFPGRGFVSFLADDHQNYPRARSLRRWTAPQEKSDAEMPTGTVKLSSFGASNSHVVAEIIPSADANRIELNLQLDSSGTLIGQVQDPFGKAILETRYTGRIRTLVDSWNRAEKGELKLIGYDAIEGREVFIVSNDLKYSGKLSLKGKQESNFTIQLKLAGNIRGRLVDADGKPIANCRIMNWRPSFASPAEMSLETQLRSPPLPSNVKHSGSPYYETDADGRFEIKGLVPDTSYFLTASKGGGVSSTSAIYGSLDANISVQAGESKGLGDVKLGDREEIEAKVKQAMTSEPQIGAEDAKSTENSGAKALLDNTISGVVVGADRKPVAGAEIYSIISRAWEHDSLPPKLVATSDKNGRYSFRQPKLDLPDDAPARWDYRSSLVIKSPGHGFVTDRPESLLRQMEEASSPQGWIARTLAGVSGAIIGLPPAGNPIKGRILDIDGQPVANARISIQWFAGYGSSFTIQSAGKLNGRFVYNNAEQWKGAIDSLVQTIEPQRAIDVFPTATTDADGRFELKDIGANRLFTLVIQGDGIETKKVYAYNQPGKQVNAKSDYNGSGTDKYSVYPQEFTHVAGPSNPVVGKVVDYDSDKPIANALVIATSLHGTNKHLGDAKGLFTVKTDDAGNFRMKGLPVGSRNQLVCFCNKSEFPYPLLGFGVDTSSGPIERKFRMKRGVWAEGRVFDSKTKKPWTGHIDYSYMRNSELERTYPGVRFAYLQFAYWTNNDGRFRVPVWPTRGLLSYFYQPRNHEEARERPIDKYPRGSFVSAIEGFGKERGSWETFPLAVIPSNYWMTKEINPDGSIDSIEADLPLVASRSLIVKTTWPEGSGIKNYRIFNSNGNKFWHRTDSLEVEVKGLKQGERRELFAFHRGQNLIGKATVDASMPEGTVVEIKDIQKAGFIIGRLVDEDGEPITNAIINALETRWAFHPGKMSSPSKIPTDENGNFRITGIVPGNRYGAHILAPRKYMDSMMDMHIGYAFDGVTVEPGETKDLGDLKPRAVAKIEKDSDGSASTKGEAK